MRTLASIPHRQTLALLLLLAIGGLYLIYSIDVFIDQSLASAEQLRIELDEALIYGIAVTLAFGSYAVRLFRAKAADAEEQAQAIAAARRMGETDPLTGLPNRRRFDAALATAMAEGPAERCDAVMMLDLNGFKPVNDQHGHAAGDALLKAVAARFGGIMRGGDVVARIGGDEFAFLVHDVRGPAGAEAVARRILACLDGPVTVMNIRHQLSAGVGIALRRGGGHDGAALVRQADAALYRAKTAGGCALVLHDR